MKIAAFMVVKNDAYYIDMALRSVLPYVQGVYIQDQASDDGTYETAEQFSVEVGGKVYLERVDTGTEGRFDQGYNEPLWRAKAVARCEEIFKPDWILKLDADEIYSEHFFKTLAALDASGKLDEYAGVKVSGDRFISMKHRSVHPTAQESSPDGEIFIDPHVQLWRAGRGITYTTNPTMSGYLHPILQPEPEPLLWLPGICNVHLHRVFGPKALAFWAEGTDIIDRSKPLYPPTSCPNFYNSGVNMGNAQEVDFPWPDYVLSKWAAWEAGVW